MSFLYRAIAFAPSGYVAIILSYDKLSDERWAKCHLTVPYTKDLFQGHTGFPEMANAVCWKLKKAPDSP